MTLSLEQQILEEIKTRLLGTPLGPISKPANLNVERCQLREIAPAQYPFIGIYPLTEDPTEMGFLVQEALAVKLAAYVKSPAGTPIDQALDPLGQWINQQLTTDRSLGGRCMNIQQTQKIWGFALHQAPFGDLDFHFSITFRHQAADLTRP